MHYRMLAKNSLLLLSISLLTFILGLEFVGADEVVKRKKIVFLGDSLTAGYGVESDESYPSRIQDKINSDQLHYTVINAGISGDTSAGGLARIDWVLKNDPDIFILALGANDALRGFSPQVTKENLSKIIDAVKENNHDTKILIAGMLAPPNMGKEYGEKYKSLFLDLAKEKELTLIPFLLEGVAGQAEYNLQDGIHPNREGYKLISEMIWDQIKELL